jgi:hypothetical protein
VSVPVDNFRDLADKDREGICLFSCQYGDEKRSHFLERGGECGKNKLIFALVIKVNRPERQVCLTNNVFHRRGMKSSTGEAPPTGGENLVAAALPFFLRNFWHLSLHSENHIKKNERSLF